MFGCLTLAYGSIAFLLSSWLGLKVLGRGTRNLSAHFGTAGVLYVYVAYGTVKVVLYPPEHIEGFDIAFRLAIMISVFGIFSNAVYLWIHNRAT